MSAAKMVADSTQAEPDTADGRKRKKKLKKSGGKKVSLPEDDDSDLDLRRDLKPISSYIRSRGAMIEEMFRAVRGPSLQRALPDLLKSIPLEELKVHCLEQLEVMSKKRIRRILAGEESANISSSGTEDETTDEESTAGATDKEVVTKAHPADSTVSQDQVTVSKPEESQQSEPTPQPAQQAQGFVGSFVPVQVKQEPQSSADEQNDDSGDDSRDDDRYDSRDEDKDDDRDRHRYDDRDDDRDNDRDDDREEEEMREEEEEVTYTSGSEDGELVEREEPSSEPEAMEVKQEPPSDTEEGEKDGKQEGKKGEKEEGGEMMDKMELLELEMRARAIKAMLSTQETQEDGDG